MSNVSITSPDWLVLKIHNKELAKAIKGYACGQLLDIGCGEKPYKNLTSYYVANHFGLDHPGSLHNKDSINIFATAYDTAIKSGSIDTILCTAVLEHLERPRSAILEMSRVLKPGGYVILTAPLYWHLHEEPRDFFRYTGYGLRYLFEEVGFEIVELRNLSGFWVTFGTELSYYIQRFAKGPLVYAVRLFRISLNVFMNLFDKSFLKDERFGWMYLTVARKPVCHT